MSAQAQPKLCLIVGGLTRPPMMLGIPLVLLLAEIMVTILLFIWIRNLFQLLIMLPIHSVAYYLTVRDIRFVDIFIVHVTKTLPVKNFRFWGGQSYSP